MAVITLTTDYGVKDHYVAALKGALHCEVDDPKIVDVSHHIQTFNITEAAFILSNAYQHFPKGSVHLILVEAETMPNREHLIMQLNGHYFVAADNGILAILDPEQKHDVMVEIDLRSNTDLPSVHEIFSRVAGHILRGGTPDLLGRKTTEYKKLGAQNPVSKEDGQFLMGKIIYIDKYGNLITNLSKQFITAEAKGRKFKILLPKGRKPITKVCNHYFEEVHEGNAMALFNSADLLEIALSKTANDTFGGASALLGMRVNDHINIEFS